MPPKMLVASLSCSQISILSFVFRLINKKQTSQHLLVALSQSSSKPPKAQSADATVGDLPPPSVASVEKLRELSTKKLSEIVRRSMGGERGWDGYDQAELIAARELLDRDAQSVQR
jgi:hypothetical protein